MTYQGTFSVTTGNNTIQQSGSWLTSGGTFNFLVCQFTPPGAAPDVLENNEEELVDYGVDTARWRRLNKQFRDFQLRTVIDCDTYDSGIALRRTYLQVIGAIGILSVSLAGNTYQWRSVKIKGCVPELYRGKMTGSGALSNGDAVVVATWTMKLANQEGVS